MGKKLKITKLAILFTLYFFLGFNSSLDHGLYSANVAGTNSSELALQWPSGSHNICGDPLPGQGVQEEFVLLISDGRRFHNGTTVSISQSHKITIAMVYPSENVTFIVDGENFTGRISLDVGIHIVQVNESSTMRLRNVKVLDQETYKAIQSENVEPEGLRLKAAILAAFGTLIGLPFGMLLKHRRAKPYEL